MSSMYSGIGLISGLDYESIVEKLIAVDARPRDLLVQRMGTIDAQRTAYLDISARITAILSRIGQLAGPGTFQSAKASSSAPDVLAVSAGAGARPGTYSFVVRALASAHQAVSRGFYDRTAPLSAGTLTIESAQARVDRATRLDQLNGHTGVQRGRFRITDAAGQAAVIDTSDVLTLGEVVDRINQAGIGVRATVGDAGLELTDSSGGSGTLRVDELDGGQAAAGLGFGPGYRYDGDGDGRLVGSTILYLAGTTPLAELNDGLGVRRSLAGGDFTMKVDGRLITVDLGDSLKPETRLARLNHGQGVRLGRIRITSRDGRLTEVDLGNASTIQDVKTALESAFSDGRLTVVLTGSRLIVSDKTTPPEGVTASDFQITDLTGQAARDLGIDGRSQTGKIDGRDILHMDTLADVLQAITYAAGNEGADKAPLVTASIADDGRRLVLESRAPGALVIEAPASGRSRALEDLGLKAGTYADLGGGAALTGARIVGGLDTVLLKTLRGGAGLAGGTIRIAANGRSADVDLAGAETLADVVRSINDAAAAAGLGLAVRHDVTGTRLEVENVGGGATPVAISDVAGTFAADSGLAQTAVLVRSANLQRRYVSENTRLADLSAGRGVALGSFKITTGAGHTATVNLTRGTVETLQDVIDAINATGIGVQARINDTGDGLLIVDTAASGTLKIEEAGGTVARDLNILGESADGRRDGSFEFRLDLSGSDTLDGLAARIGAETTLATATVLNDGTGVSPYRLSLAARVSGARGELIFDDGGSGLGLATLARAQDARLLFGGGAGGVLLTSADNTFKDVVGGLTLTATSVSDTPVSVTVGQDIDALVGLLSGLVNDYNATIDRIAQAGDYDAETQQAGILLGHGTLQLIESRLFRMFTRPSAAGGSVLTRLSQVGLKAVQGAKLSFDEAKFRAAYAADPEAVTRFFTAEGSGVALRIKAELEALTNEDGLIQRQTEVLAGQKELLEQRVTRLNELLESKRARLLREFQTLESSLALLQSQQAALANLATLAQSTSVFATTSSR